MHSESLSITLRCGLSGRECEGKEDIGHYLVRVVLKRAVVTVVSHAIPVGIPLVHIVHVLTVVLLVQNAW